MPAQITFIIKIRYDKIMRIIMYRYYATTFFLLSTFQAFFSDFFGSGSEREGLWVWVLGLGFFGFVAGVDKVYFGFWWFPGLVKWDWSSHSFLKFCPEGANFSSVS